MPDSFGEWGLTGSNPPPAAAAVPAAVSARQASRPVRARNRVRTGWHSKLAMEASRVELPADVGAQLEVFVNGVPQRVGADCDRLGRTLVFRRPLAKEGRLGFWRWLSLFLGVAGTYRQNDSVDVVYEAVGGRRVVAAGLPLRPD